MLDLTQLLLILVITVLTIILTLIGFQFFYLLKELRFSLKKMNKVLDNAGTVSTLVTEKVNNLNALADNFLQIFSFLKYFKKN